jgi:hypothetical protein
MEHEPEVSDLQVAEAVDELGTTIAHVLAGFAVSLRDMVDSVGSAEEVRRVQRWADVIDAAMLHIVSTLGPAASTFGEIAPSDTADPA